MISQRTCTFVGLTAVRVLSIVSLLLVLSSNILVMVQDIQAVNRFIHASVTGDSNMAEGSDCEYIEGSTVPNQPAGAFWAVLNRVLIIGQLIVLIMSEMSWPMGFFRKYFPVLGDEFGLGALGIIQALIAASILSHRIATFPLVAAFLLFAVACLNMLLGLLYREKAKSKRSLRAWREEPKSALSTGDSILPSHTGIQIQQTRHVHTDKPQPSFGFGRQGEKKAGLKGFLISAPLETLPRYASQIPTSGSRSTSPTRS